ncbi:flagellin [Polynucleobacter sp. MWH-UH23A]|uniref:flagellin N-terminal helical domain-containing protein n=1 Tax=Polynucleobacter sp. MWH-UH23A TaxID=1855613 RepID=UPI00336502CB
MVTINTNISSLYAQQNLAETQKTLTETITHLSTGKRVNSAQDDAASLAISQSMVSQILSINQSVSNLNNATNLMQIADTGLSSLQDMFLRINELAIQGRNDSLNGSQKISIVKELSALNDEIDHVIDRTKMNGNGLLTNYGVLNGGSGLQVGSVNVGVLDSTVASSIDVSGARPGIYKFSNIGAELTLTKTDLNDNTLGNQTVTVATPTGARGSTYNQTLDFSAFGISINLRSTTIGVNGLTDSGEEIAHNLNNIFKPIIVDEAVRLNFGTDGTNRSLISFRPINLTTVAAPDAVLGENLNQNGISNTNTGAIQVLASAETVKGSYAITVNQSAAASEFELVGFSNSGTGNASPSTVGINSGFTLTVGNRTYKANGDKVVGGVTTSGAVPVLSGSNVNVDTFTSWINSLNDNNISARLYQRSTGDYAIKINGGQTGADNAVSFTNMNLVVANNFLTNTKIYGNVSLAADGKLTTSFTYTVSDPYSASPITTTGGISAYEGNNSTYLSYNSSQAAYLSSSYSNYLTTTTRTSGGITGTTELSPNPAYVSYYPYANPYSIYYDPNYSSYAWYLGTRDQPSSSSYAYSSATWNANYTSNIQIMNSVVGIDPARDATLTITNGGTTRRLTESTNTFTDATTGLILNVGTGRQAWDGAATANIVVGDALPPLPRNNSNLVAVDQKITAMENFTANTSTADWHAAFDFLQDQSDKALDYLSYERGIIGAQINRVAFINTNLRSQGQNLDKSKSDLVDADIGAETAQFAKSQLQQRVASQMVTQANSLANPIKTMIGLWDDIKSK